MSTLKVEQLARRRLPVAELHPHLMCMLCGGYYIDATTIIECLHSFCKSCLVRYLETNKYCPICEVQVHKTKPLLNIRPDETLQNMVYKLVPGLFFREMKFRQEFYAKHPEAPPSSPEDRGVVDPIECQFYSPEEPVSLSLEYKHDSLSNNNKAVYKRYLRCPAAVTVAHLEKLVRNKYDLSPSHKVDVMFNDKVLMPHISIMDVAYSFQRKRKEQFNFTYHILETPCKKRKVEELKEEASEQIEVDPPPPTLLSSLSTVPVKATSSSRPESRSKLDSIISRLGSAKKTENVLKRDKSSDEWKEVQLQISESGVMSVTDISSIDKLINSLDKNIEPSVSEKSSAQKVDANSERKKSQGELKPAENTIPPQVIIGNTPKPGSQDRKEVQKVESAKNNKATNAADLVKNDSKTEVLKMPLDRKDDVKKPSTPEKCDRNTVTQVNSCSPLTGPAVKSSLQQSSSTVKVSASSVPTLSISSQSNVPSVSGVTGTVSTCNTSKSCAVTPVTSQDILVASAASSVSSIPSVSKSVSKPPISMNSALTTTTVTRAAPVPVAKPAPNAQPSKKSSSSPVGYKTLKCGPKNWNPTISRNSFLSSKAEQQPQQQGSSSATGSGQGGSGKPATPAKFFKMRNTPRFLGNPASGVKAMYQISDSKPKTPPPTKTPSVTKLDPRTLSPIVSNASSLTSKSSPTQPKARPPFPSTTLSAQVSNHVPSSRVVATTTTTSSSSTKHTDLTSLKNSPTQPLVNPFTFTHNPFLTKGIPNFLYGPGLLPTNAQFASMMNPALGYPPMTSSGFHQALPQPASMLFNSHPLHRQLNSSSPGSPTRYSTSLQSSSLSLPPSTSSSSSSSSSKTYPAGQRTVPVSDKVSTTSCSQSSPSPIQNNSLGLGFGTQGSAKVNGSEPMKNSSANQDKTSLLSKDEHNSGGKTKAGASKDVETTTSNVSNNNNTLPTSREKLQLEKPDVGKLSPDTSNLVSKEKGRCSDEQLVTRPKTSSSTSVQAQQT